MMYVGVHCLGPSDARNIQGDERPRRPAGLGAPELAAGIQRIYP